MVTERHPSLETTRLWLGWAWRGLKNWSTSSVSVIPKSLKIHSIVTFGSAPILRHLQVLAIHHLSYDLNLCVFGFTPFVLSFFSLDIVARAQLFAFPFFLRVACAGALEAL